MKAKLRSILVLAIVISVALVPLMSDDSEASAYITCEGLNVSTFDDNININAGGSSSVSLSLRNDSTGDITVKLSSVIPEDSDMAVSFDSNDFTLSKGKTAIVHATFSCDRTATHGTYASSIMFTLYNYSTAKEGSASLPITCTVATEYAADASFNKIFGMFDNNLPEPFNGPVTSAIITGIIWIIIAALAYIVLHIITGRYFKSEDDERRTVRRRSGALIIAVILLYGLIESLKVYGVDENLIRVLSEISRFINILMVAYIIWDLYKAVINHIFHKLEKQNKLVGVDSSLMPLCNMIGQIIICVAALAGILSILGVDLVAIFASAGILALAISIGAQNILSQFFGGITLLITRPFKTGDVVKINGSSDYYVVQKIGLLCTTFKNWDSLDIITMPNNSVGSDNIVNVTNDSNVYRLYLYYNVDVDSDFSKVRDILTETAFKHPDVITDGSVARPDVRVNEFLSSGVQVRLGVYIKDFNDSLRVTDELYLAGFNDLKNNGVNISYEKCDVHFIVDETIKNSE